VTVVTVGTNPVPYVMV